MTTKIKLDSQKLKKLLEEKGKLIEEGRIKSDYIEIYEQKLEDIDKEIQKEENLVDISDLLDKEREQTKIVEECIEKMKEIKQEIYDRLKEKVNSDLYTKYEETKTQKEELEEARNKFAIEAQKYNDKIIPLGRKLMKEHLKDEFDDYDTLRLEDGEIVCTLFNHLEDFKTNFRKK